MIPHITVSEIVFVLTLAATFAAALFARYHSKKDKDIGLSEIKLNRWLVGLSAGTTANSGFIVTGAVGLGYTYGLHWVMLPFSWLLGDLVFWYFFPPRINAIGQQAQATTLSELLTNSISGKVASMIALLCALVILTCLTGYTSAQWLAGQKFLAGAFALPDWVALGLFALLIILYSSIGGFRGSVYTDTLQAVIRIIGTIIALIAVADAALADRATFLININAAGADFMNWFPGGTVAAVGFICGWAAAAIGFGLGQPQILSRYLAGRNPQETQSAWWIYMGFTQFTWIAMTVFGVILRGVMPNIADAETGLSVFFQNNVGPFLTGIIVADVFATIAATSNGLLIAISQSVSHDIIQRWIRPQIKIPLAFITMGAGIVTMSLSMVLKGSVASVVLSAISFMGAGLAPAVMIKVMGWKHSGVSLLCTILAGILAAVVWKNGSLGGTVNEAGIGILMGLILNWFVARIASRT